MKKKTYEFEMTIEATSQEDAESKMRALAALLSGLTTEELKKLAYIIKHDPAKTTLAKKYLGV